MINFDCNTFSLISEEVSLAMQHTTKKSQEHRTPSFGADQFIKAEIEKARYQISGLLNTNANMLFFDTSNQNSDIHLIFLLINLLGIELVITSKSENKNKIEFLNQLHKIGKIELILVNSNVLDRFDSKYLADIVNSGKQKKLVTLSHANRYSGELLPVKEIVSICKQDNAFFHLNCNLTIGKYHIDFEKLYPDFMSFSSNLINGPVGIGGIILNSSFKIDQAYFNLIYRYLLNAETRNLPIISGFKMALSLAYKSLDANQKKINNLKEYLLKNLFTIPEIGVFKLENDKNGLLNLIPLLLQTAKFGKHVKEKFELDGITVDDVLILAKDSINYKEILLPIALDGNNSKSDVDFLIKFLKSTKCKI